MAPKVAVCQDHVRSLLKIPIFWFNSNRKNLIFWIWGLWVQFSSLNINSLSNFRAPTKDSFTKTFRKHFSGPVILELVCASEAPRNLIKTQNWPLRVSDSVGLEWRLSICVSNKFPGDAYAAGPETTLRETTTPTQVTCEHLYYSSALIMWPRTGLLKKE